MDRPPRRRPDGHVTRREFLGLAGLAGLGTLLDAAGLSPGRIRRVLRRARSALGRPLHLRNAVGDLLSRSYPYDPSEIGIEITRPTISVDALPAALDGLTIAQLSDLHVGPDLDGDAVAAVVAQVNALEPDMVALTGDFVRGSSDAILSAVPALEVLEAPLGAYAVLGNHEAWNDADRVARELAAAGIRVLRDEAATVAVGDARLHLLGVDDVGYTGYTGGGLEALARRWRGAVDRLRALLREVDGGPRVLLVHNPDVNELLDGEWPIDLALCGHTHGGQVRLPYVGALYLPSVMGNKYAGGLARAPAGPVYVNRGIGVTGIPLRIHCPPEITLLTLRPSEERPAP